MSRSASLSLILLLAVMTLAGCVRTIQINPESVTAEEAQAVASHYGNIRVVDDMGVVYTAHTLTGADSDTLFMTLVDVVDDGVVSHEAEMILLKERVVDIRYGENNPWVVATAVGATGLLMAVLYWNINGHF